MTHFFHSLIESFRQVSFNPGTQFFVTHLTKFADIKIVNCPSCNSAVRAYFRIMKYCNENKKE